ncbi:hypothetical protein ACM46_01940 [Chryseobacterium angstadtii]|uniref:Lipoprotein n=1 Tax=Chryseobacterium angstadtii TaxID=558151 RepID=A0A0J7LBK4_9FLAO|nr:hypothetical protein [Chryseobacterium angstadtii]KMQ66330.1 hypothetical protein ACM46_01940 [Chryseobacterium angstadtii]
MNEITKTLTCLFVLIILFSCEKNDCLKYSQILSKEECNIIVDLEPANSVWFEIKGHDPITQEPKVCKTHNRWWNLYADEIEFGDTVVKKRGELTFNIHKKDTIITHEWEKCNDIDTTLRKGP